MTLDLIGGCPLTRSITYTYSNFADISPVQNEQVLKVKATASMEPSLLAWCYGYRSPFGLPRCLRKCWGSTRSWLDHVFARCPPWSRLCSLMSVSHSVLLGSATPALCACWRGLWICRSLEIWRSTSSASGYTSSWIDWRVWWNACVWMLVAKFSNLITVY